MVRYLTAVVLVASVLGLWTSPSNAHTALLQASPSADQTVGGMVDGVDLAFLDPISDAIVTVSYNGAPVPGTTVVSNGELIRFEFEEPLQIDGRYQVFYEMTSFDLDYTTSGFFFTYSADAAPPIPLEDPAAGGDSSFPIVPTVIGTTVLVAALGLFVWQFDARRRAAAPANDEWYDEDGYQEAANQAPGYRDFSYGDDGSDDDDW
ncbi:MAG: copper resistance protein CopC [Acidimicrobiales bacterium]